MSARTVGITGWYTDSWKPIYDMKSGARACWFASPRMCKFHASIDGGASALCGVRALTTENPYPTVVDPSHHIMACDRCLERITHRTVESEPR